MPSSLFTVECWNEVKQALTPTGLVAINFAGNITSLASRLVFSTILSSFAHCRAFEDGPHRTDYRNLVFFCSASSPIVLRAPVAGDYLPHPSGGVRRKVLDTFGDWEMDLTEVEREDAVRDGKGEAQLSRAQGPGAVQHWEIMKRVLPDEAWALY